MNAVLRVDHKLRTVPFRHHLVNAYGAVALGRLIEAGQVLPNGEARVRQLQVAGLILFMVGVGEIDRRGFIKAEHPVGLRVGRRLAGTGGLQGRVVRRFIAQGKGQLAGKERLVHPGKG